MGKKLVDYSLNTFELWCYRALDHFREVEDEKGLAMIVSTMKIVKIFREYEGDLFFDD